MGQAIEWTWAGHAGELAARTWPSAEPRWLAVLAHDYGEHIGRYADVAEALVDRGAVVVGHDHAGHGRSAGPRALIEDVEPVVDDLRAILHQAQDGYPELPTVLIGHSMGGMIAARFAQRFPADLAALVLNAPILGDWQVLDLLAEDDVPDDPIDPHLLSSVDSVRAGYLADELVWHGGFNRTTLQAIEKCLRTISAGASFGETLPTLWLHGEDDGLVPVADTRAGMDHLRGIATTERIYPGARHELFHEWNGAAVLNDVVSFVSGVLTE